MTQTKRRLISAALMAGMLFLSSIYSLQGVLLTNLIEHYSLSVSAQGLASSAASLGGVIALVSSILLIGRVPKLTLLKISFLICSVFLALLSFAPAFGLFLLLWLVLGLGMGYIDTLLSSCMADLFTGRKGTRMMCLLHMLYGVSAMVCPVIYTSLLKAGIEWRRVYLPVSLAGAVLTVYAVIAARGLSKGDKDLKMNFRDMAKVIRSGSLPWLILAMLCHGFFLGGLNTWISRYISVSLGSAIGDTALTYLFSGVMISRLVVPYLPFSPKKYVRFAGLLSGAVLLLAIPFHSGLLMAVAVFIAGILFGAMIPCALDIGCAITKESSMLATTLMMLALYVSQVIVSPIVGMIDAAVGLDYGIALLGVFMMLTSACCMRIKANLGGIHI